MPVTLITGPPCAGKSTLAKQLAQPGDVVLDWDDICVELGSSHQWAHSAQVREQAEAVMQQRMWQLAGWQGAAYVIRCAAEANARTRLARRLGAVVWVLDPGHAECVRRARVDGRPRGTTQAIRQWYQRYRRGPLDQSPPVTTHSDVTESDGHWSRVW